MNEYTPTPDEVRDRYADACAGIGEWTRFDESVRRAVEEAYEEFDRMIASVEREAAARALEAEADRIYSGPTADTIIAGLRARAAEIRGNRGHDKE